MLKHRYEAAGVDAPIVVVGSGGFIAGRVIAKLAALGAPIRPLGRPRLDLLTDGAEAVLREAFTPDARVFVASARAPCRNTVMLIDNLRMVDVIVRVLAQRPVAHLVYLSSDAVYHDSSRPLTEASPAAPASLHGVMHLARELALGSVPGLSLGILRPTLVYGAGDPHNGYGPNRFRRLALDDHPIPMMGQGEERRDHVWVEDVAELAARMLVRESSGVLNAVTGRLATFRELAEITVAAAGSASEFRFLERSGPMPHDGYRAFDPSAAAEAFPDFAFTPLETGLGQAVAAERAGPVG